MEDFIAFPIYSDMRNVWKLFLFVISTILFLFRAHASARILNERFIFENAIQVRNKWSIKTARSNTEFPFARFPVRDSLKSFPSLSCIFYEHVTKRIRTIF